MSNSGDYQQRIRQKLSAALSPERLEIMDDSQKHAGHQGHDPRGETHFRILIVSAAFTNLSRLARHRLIYDALKAEMEERVHALTLKALTPTEADAK